MLDLLDRQSKRLTTTVGLIFSGLRIVEQNRPSTGSQTATQDVQGRARFRSKRRTHLACRARAIINRNNLRRAISADNLLGLDLEKATLPSRFAVRCQKISVSGGQAFAQRHLWRPAKRGQF